MQTAWDRFRQTTMHGNVVLNFTPFPKGELASYAHAYHEAANRLLERLQQENGYSDLDACPIVFLYRHSVELYLKAIILWGCGLVALQSGEHIDTDALFRTHSLAVLLKPTKRVFKEAGWLNLPKGKPFATFEGIEDAILILEQIDPQSFAFRYPIDPKGNAHLPKNFLFNVITLGAEANNMLRMLDGAAMGIYEMFQTMASVQAEYVPSIW